MIQDYILVEGLAVKARIGVYEWEQKIDQKLLVDLTLGTSFDAAAAEDNIDDTLSYAWLADEISRRIKATNHALLETLIKELGDWLQALEGVQSFELSIKKPGAVPNTKAVGVRRCFQKIE